MVDGFLDTSILIDILRRYGPAQQWLASQQHLGITPIAFLEVVDGSRNKQEQATALNLLKKFQLIYLIQQDFDWSMQRSMLFRLSHNTGMMDCLIASVNARLQVPLYTINLKHFVPLLGTLAQRPY